MYKNILKFTHSFIIYLPSISVFLPALIHSFVLPDSCTNSSLLLSYLLLLFHSVFVELWFSFVISLTVCLPFIVFHSAQVGSLFVGLSHSFSLAFSVFLYHSLLSHVLRLFVARFLASFLKQRFDVKRTLLRHRPPRSSSSSSSSLYSFDTYRENFLTPLRFSDYLQFVQLN